MQRMLPQTRVGGPLNSAAFQRSESCPAGKPPDCCFDLEAVFSRTRWAHQRTACLTPLAALFNNNLTVRADNETA